MDIVSIIIFCLVILAIVLAIISISRIVMQFLRWVFEKTDILKKLGTGISFLIYKISYHIALGIKDAKEGG